VKAVSVIPALRFVDAAVEALKRSSRRRVLRKREHWNDDKKREQIEQLPSHSATFLTAYPFVRKDFSTGDNFTRF
jgi:hypothetical protein